MVTIIWYPQVPIFIVAVDCVRVFVTWNFWILHFKTPNTGVLICVVFPSKFCAKRLFALPLSYLASRVCCFLAAAWSRISAPGLSQQSSSPANWYGKWHVSVYLSVLMMEICTTYVRAEKRWCLTTRWWKWLPQSSSSSPASVMNM